MSSQDAAGASGARRGCSRMNGDIYQQLMSIGNLGLVREQPDVTQGLDEGGRALRAAHEMMPSPYNGLADAITQRAAQDGLCLGNAIARAVRCGVAVGIALEGKARVDADVLGAAGEQALRGDLDHLQRVVSTWAVPRTAPALPSWRNLAEFLAASSTPLALQLNLYLKQRVYIGK